MAPQETTFTSTLSKFDHNVWGYYFPVPADLAEKVIQNSEDRRIICSVDESLTFHCALMPDKDRYFILMNKPNVEKLGLKEDDKAQISIKKDTSEYGMHLPESFGALLEQDEEGAAYFHELTPGKQRNLIYIVNKVKSIDKQINKGLAILDHLKQVKGQLDFKQLNETIKLYNQRDKLP